MTASINGTTGITFPDATTQNTSPYTGGLAFRNRIINGDMTIDQRNAGASVTVNNTENYPVDRSNVRCNTSGISATAQQSSTAPTGFKKSVLVSVTTGASAGSGDRGYFLQNIEGFNVADFGLGTASASSFTLSFWVRSSLTGTFSGAFQNNAQDRSYVFTYTISAANTWEYKTIVVSAGDTTGTWLSDNSVGLRVFLDLGNGSSLKTATTGSWIAGDYRGANGSVSPFANSGATFYITGVQLEKGSTATSFDYRPYGTELALCQRYYFRNTPGGAYSQLGYFGMAVNTTAIVGPAMYPVQMRATPAVNTSNARLIDGVNPISIGSISISWSGTWATEITFNVTGATQFRPYYLQNNNNAAGWIEFSSEL